jgi:hypothetical protein
MSRRVRLATGGRIEQWCSSCGWVAWPGLGHMVNHAVATVNRLISFFRGPRPPAAPVTIARGAQISISIKDEQAEVDAALAPLGMELRARRMLA